MICGQRSVRGNRAKCGGQRFVSVESERSAEKKKRRPQAPTPSMPAVPIVVRFVLAVCSSSCSIRSLVHVAEFSDVVEYGLPLVCKGLNSFRSSPPPPSPHPTPPHPNPPPRCPRVLQSWKALSPTAPTVAERIIMQLVGLGLIVPVRKWMFKGSKCFLTMYR